MFHDVCSMVVVDAARVSRAAGGGHRLATETALRGAKPAATAVETNMSYSYQKEINSAVWQFML
jgi:hypothetical protein